MNRKAPVSYPQLAETCNAWVKAGKKPTLRQLREKLGRSFSTLTPLLKQW